MDVVRHQPNQGWIEVIVGSMFSGKSEELIRRLRRAQIARQRVQIFKPALDTRYAVLAGLLPAGEDERVRRLLTKLGFSLWSDALHARDGDGQLAILRGLKEFQEHLGGELTVTLIDAVGHGVEVNRMDPALIADAIAWLHGSQR